MRWTGSTAPKGFDGGNSLGLLDYWTLKAAAHDKDGKTVDPPFLFNRTDSSYAYQVRSLGPDKLFESGEFPNLYPDGPKKGLVVDYDPTNGTISRGDVFSFGPGN
jgi:hypothetical protein